MDDSPQNTQWIICSCWLSLSTPEARSLIPGSSNSSGLALRAAHRALKMDKLLKGHEISLITSPKLTQLPLKFHLKEIEKALYLTLIDPQCIPLEGSTTDTEMLNGFLYQHHRSDYQINL